MQPQNPSVIMQLVPFLAIAAIFYFLLIRPQQKQLKETKLMLEALKTGDKVLTRGGIYGTITAVNGEEIEVEIAKNVKVNFARNAVAGLANKAQ